MTVAVLGIDLRSSNKGCAALAYSFMNILNEIAKKNGITLKVSIIIPLSVSNCVQSLKSFERFDKQYTPECSYSNLVFIVRNYRYIKNTLIIDPRAYKCDIAFDFTAGDSFTDIYGQKRFYERTNIKQKFIRKHIPLVLGSQTIGPFNDKKVKKIASDVINECREVFVRDQLSFDYTEKISNRTPILTTDVAFFLDYDRNRFTFDSNKIKIGLNVSGLLWNESTRMGVTVNYKEYCCNIIESFLMDSKYEVHIINHVITDDLSIKDNDLVPSAELKKRYPKLIISPKFRTPMDAKSYISNMDCFIGARMHATIGAFSSGVAVIPFSYSRKFEGLFESLNYNVTISGTSLITDEAVRSTLSYVKEYKELQKMVRNGLALVQKKSDLLIKETEKILFELKKAK